MEAWKRTRAIVAMALGLAIAQQALAQDSFPTKPIRLIVPFSAGGGTDTFARTIAQSMGTQLGQTVVVDNRPGAGGNIGAEAVAKSAPDGYTWLLAQDSLAVVPWLSKSLPFDVNRDFAPIGIGVFMPMILVVSNDTPAKNLAELIAYAKANPGKLSYGTPGTGTAHHFNFEAFLARTGTQVVHVPYKGAAPMMGDLAGGNIQVAFAALSSAAPLIRSGKIRPIAVADRDRVPQFPELPTIAETYPGYTANVWFGLAVPAATPPDVVRKITQAFKVTMASAEVRDRLMGLGYQVNATTAEEMSRILASEYRKWGEVAKQAAIHPE